MMIRKWRERRKRRNDFDRFRLERLAAVGQKELELQAWAAERGLQVFRIVGVPTIVELLEQGGVEVGRFSLQQIEGAPLEARSLQVEAVDRGLS
jgi:hypothetical protein